jgi:sialate O-acetylesterase
MEWTPTSGITNAEEAIANANFPQIRFFTVDHRTAGDPQIDLNSTGWTECSPETMKNFSAVAYFFAKRIFEETGTPVGLINSSWGGTPAEAWTPEDVFEKDQLLSASADKLQEVPWGPVEPGRLYNSMIAPLTNFKIAGTIWYQGEANTRNASTYKETFSSLIKSWRENWGYDFPFYFVQIAPFAYGDNQDGVMIRDAQRRTLELPNTGMAVICDIGDTTDIHPKNKEDVGFRLANLALKHHYRVLDQIADSPLYSGFTVDKDKVIVSFKHSTRLHAVNKKSELFELAGADGKFYPASTTIKNEQVILRAKHVDSPEQVRYAWGNTTAADLHNEAELPASSFISE